MRARLSLGGGRGRGRGEQKGAGTAGRDLQRLERWGHKDVHWSHTPPSSLRLSPVSYAVSRVHAAAHGSAAGAPGALRIPGLIMGFIGLDGWAAPAKPERVAKEYHLAFTSPDSMGPDDAVGEPHDVPRPMTHAALRLLCRAVPLARDARRASTTRIVLYPLVIMLATRAERALVWLAANLLLRRCAPLVFCSSSRHFSGISEWPGQTTPPVLEMPS
jgi:hypothetical protein